MVWRGEAVTGHTAADHDDAGVAQRRVLCDGGEGGTSWGAHGGCSRTSRERVTTLIPYGGRGPVRRTFALVGPGAPIVVPAVSHRLDYEAELAVVIGSGGRAIPAERALDHVLGYTLLNDGSVRDCTDEIVAGYRSLQLDALIGIGGDGSLDILRRIALAGGVFGGAGAEFAILLRFLWSWLG